MTYQEYTNQYAGLILDMRALYNEAKATDLFPKLGQNHPGREKQIAIMQQHRDWLKSSSR